MSIKDKLEAIDYICNHCQTGFRPAEKCRAQSGDHDLIMTAEDRFEYCSILRDRVEKMDRLFNRTIFSDEIKRQIKINTKQQ